MKYKIWSILLALILLLAAVVLLIDGNTTTSLPLNYWQQPAATSKPPPHGWSMLEQNLKPEACAQCHAEQFSAWKESMHAQAYSPGLIGQFPSLSHGDRNDCLNCHAPLTEQKYLNDFDMINSLALKLKQPDGFDHSADLEEVQLPLRHAGVTCAACHVRQWQRFGPPQRNKATVGQINTPAHGGFIATKAFEQSTFCASCHQFPQEYAINGKPMENTIEEWKQSRFAREGIQCQGCHMPDRRHEFKGIHDSTMVKKGLLIQSSRIPNGAELTITSTWIGHAFPTYVTPKVLIRAEVLDKNRNALQHREWEIIREVSYNNGWKEIRDTRLLQDESRQYVIDKLPHDAWQVHFIITIIPDHFYKGLYHSLLDQESLKGDARKLISQALKDADSNDYQLYSNIVTIGK